MRESLFAKYLEKDFRGMVQQTFDELKEEEGYVFKELFKESYHWGLTFDSLVSKGLILGSDLVGLEGLLSKRISQGSSEDVIPKTQGRIQHKESDLRDYIQMEPLGLSRQGVLDTIRYDIKESLKCFYGQIEQMCLEGLSRGMYELKDHKDPQKSHRVLLRISSENVFRASESWQGVGAKALDDIEKVLEAALKKDHQIKRILMPYEVLKLLRNSHQFKERYPTESSLKRINEYLSEDYGSGIDIKVIRSRVKVRKAQGEVLVNPWEEGKVVFLSHKQAGALLYCEFSIDKVYDELIKKQRPQGYVSISKFSKVDPYREYTLAEGRVMPVLRDPEGIYYLKV